MIESEGDRTSGGPSSAVRAIDIVATLAVPILTVLSAFPEAITFRVAKFLSRLAPAFRSATESERKSLALSFPVEDPVAFQYEVKALQYFEQLQIFRLQAAGVRPPRVPLRGGGHIDRALAEGRGVILWIVPTAFAPIFAKIGLAQAGYPSAHLARPSHGFSNTRFGRKFLNPLRTRLEDKYLFKRVLIQDDVRSALGEISDHLRANGIVSLAVGVQANWVATVPFLRGTLTAATRPPKLAREHGCPILPVVCCRMDDGEFVADVGPPLGQTALTDLSEWLEPFGRRFPAQFALSRIFSFEESRRGRQKTDTSEAISNQIRRGWRPARGKAQSLFRKGERERAQG